MMPVDPLQFPSPLRVFEPDAQPYPEWAAQVLLFRQQWRDLHRDDLKLDDADEVSTAPPSRMSQ